MANKGHLFALVAIDKTKHPRRKLNVETVHIKGLYSSEQSVFAIRYKASLTITPFLLIQK